MSTPLAKPGSQCALCYDTSSDDYKLGHLYALDSTTAFHHYCLLFSSGLSQSGEDEEGILGFLQADITKELNRGKRLPCTFCNKIGATIGCVNRKCRHSYHMRCGLERCAQFSFSGDFRSWCSAHRTYQEMPKHKVDCPICMEEVLSTKPNDVLWAPCCKRKDFFHKTCVQHLALSAGYFFKCPLCNDKDKFTLAMQSFGIYVPEQDASWEREPNAYQDLLERPLSCEAAICMSPLGRTHKDDKSFELTYCQMCGSHAIHNKCQVLVGRSRDIDWHCAECTSMLAEGARRERTRSRAKRAAAAHKEATAAHKEAAAAEPGHASTSEENKTTVPSDDVCVEENKGSTVVENNSSVVAGNSTSVAKEKVHSPVKKNTHSLIEEIETSVNAMKSSKDIVEVNISKEITTNILLKEDLIENNDDLLGSSESPVLTDEKANRISIEIGKKVTEGEESEDNDEIIINERHRDLVNSFNKSKIASEFIPLYLSDDEPMVNDTKFNGTDHSKSPIKNGFNSVESSVPQQAKDTRHVNGSSDVSTVTPSGRDLDDSFSSLTSTPKRKMSDTPDHKSNTKAAKRWTPRLKFGQKSCKKGLNESGMKDNCFDQDESLPMMETSSSSDDSKFSGFASSTDEYKENKPSPSKRCKNNSSSHETSSNTPKAKVLKRQRKKDLHKTTQISITSYFKNKS